MSKKANNIVYWIATVWLCLGMLSTAIVQLIKMEEEVVAFERLGFPLYVLALLGLWKILGVIAVLLPKTPVLKEWAYAGFFFAMSGAAVAHIAVGDAVQEILPCLLLLLLTVVSWYFRPESRKTK